MLQKEMRSFYKDDKKTQWMKSLKDESLAYLAKSGFVV